MGAKKTIIFGIPRLGLTILLGIEAYSVFALYTIGYKLSPFLVGFTLCVGYICTSIFSFLFGWVSDRRYTTWGRRKPYIFIFSPIFSISFIFLLIPSLILPNLNDKLVLFTWLLIWEIAFRVSLSAMTPYQAWLAEQFDITERPKVSQVQNVFNLFGTFILWTFNFIVLTDVFDTFETSVNIIPLNFSLPIIFFALVSVILLFLNVFMMPTEPYLEIKSNLGKILRQSLKNKDFMIISFMLGLSSISWSMIVAQILPYFDQVLHFTTIENLISLIIVFGVIVVFLDVWRRIMRKFGRKRALIYIFYLAIISLPLTLLNLLPLNSYFFLNTFILIGIGASLAGWFLVPAVIYADLAQGDHEKTGELKAGTYTGFPLIFLNLFQAFGIFLLGIINEMPQINVGVSFYSIGLILWGPICSIILGVSLIFIWKFVQI
jgi:GPH family glycoside/pentoside/hexuronide:cation symporter